MRAGIRIAATAARGLPRVAVRLYRAAAHAADFGHEHAARRAAGGGWIGDTVDNQTGDNLLPLFAILDKKEARVYVFNAAGLRSRGAGPARAGPRRYRLPGIGARELSAIPPKHRVTQAGRFVSKSAPIRTDRTCSGSTTKALAMHRVIATNQRAQVAPPGHADAARQPHLLGLHQSR
jgi:hypothetical protein